MSPIARTLVDTFFKKRVASIKKAASDVYYSLSKLE